MTEPLPLTWEAAQRVATERPRCARCDSPMVGYLVRSAPAKDGLDRSAKVGGAQVKFSCDCGYGESVPVESPP